MSGSCIRPEDLGDFDALPADDPIRAHLADCPRCQARLQAYRSFLGDAGSPARSRAESEADAALGGMIRRQFGLLGAESGPARGPSATGRRGLFSFRWRIRTLILAPSAIAAAVVILVLARHDRTEIPAPAYRGSESGAAVRVESMQELADGRIRLTWHALSGADAYQVRVLDTGLNPVLAPTVSADTTADLDRSELGAAARPGSRLLWRVTALQDGEEIGTSGVEILRLP
jgi:hypothetical protein